jgi:hypothetical protein|tara:strand:+ start:420 stop:1202 length:783 start_codon:yes stop_codon:yes gene_type:complete
MPGHTSAHEKASNKKSGTTSRSYSRSYNPGKGGNNVVEHTSTKKSKPAKTFTNYTKQNLNPSDDTAAKTNLFINQGAINTKNTLKGPVLSVASPFFEKGSIKTRTYFLDDVLTSKKAKKNIGYTQDEFKKLSSTKQEEVYKSYLDNRMSGATDAFGNVSAGYSREKVVHTNKDGTKEFKEVILKSGNGSNTQERANVVTEKNVGGTTILTTEGKVAEEKAEAEEYDERKTKKRGRRRTILTSQTGATGNLELGKKSLLGV